MSYNLHATNFFRKLLKTTATVTMLVWTLASSCRTTGSDSLRFEVLMSSKMLEEIHVNEKFINSIDITPNRFILLSSANQFYLLGWGGIQPFANKITGSISSFAYTQDNFLMTISRNELCYFDSAGNLAKLHTLPSEGMGISAGQNVMYVYDHINGKSKYSLYAITKGGKYVKLFDVPKPVLSVVEIKNSLVFATGNGLYSFDLKKKDLKALAALPADKEIISIAADTLNSRIYFSTAEGLYAVKGANAITVNDQFGGILKYFNDGLLIFDTRKNLLMRMTGIEKEITSKTLAMKAATDSKKKADTLTNANIIQMVEAGLTDEFIINLINKSEVNFAVNVDAMIDLSSHSVSSAIISAMKAAMKRKPSVSPKTSN